MAAGLEVGEIITRMGLLIVAASVLAASAVAITIRALMRAPLGYEDAEGFHFGPAPGDSRPHSANRRRVDVRKSGRRRDAQYAA